MAALDSFHRAVVPRRWLVPASGGGQEEQRDDRDLVAVRHHSRQGEEFETFYGAAGDWTAVNRHSRSYVGTSFLRDQVEPSRYVVIEYWSEMVVYEEHKAYRGDELDRLAARRSELVRSFEPLGVFTVLDVPDRTGAAWSRRS